MKRYATYKPTDIPWLPEIPEEWEVKKMKYILKYHKNIVGGNSDKYDLLSLTLRGIIKRDMENPEGKFPSSFDTYQEVNKGDFVFCLFDNEETPRTVGLSTLHGMITGAYDVMTPCVKDILPEFLYYYLLYIDNGKRMKPLYRGMRKTIPFNSFMSSGVPLPPLVEQQAMVDYIEEKTAKIDGLVGKLEDEIVRLKEYRERLIADVVTGQMKVE